MSRRRLRRGIEDANISFLDIICCGFGAIVLLLVIVRPGQPVVLDESVIEDKGQVRALQERLFALRGQVTLLETDLNAKQEQLSEDQQRVAVLQGELEKLNARKPSKDDGGADDVSTVQDLQIALQSLSIEMKRLLQGRRSVNQYVAGVPVDSEYLIFIIDGSGSMTANAWGRLVKEVRSILALYPTVKGIQVMNNDGAYMFPAFRGEFMADSPQRRQQIITKLITWSSFGASTPVGGINTAIRSHYDKNKKISLFVMGDDFQGRSVRRVLQTVKKLNKANRNGDTLVRIHGVGFPVHLFSDPGINSSGMRYATLMRELAEQNNGTFIGLNNVK